MTIKKLLPPVGYKGGKRRLLPRIRPYLNPEKIQLYVEPFVGMGAVYLDLRARGYKGPAILADANPDVAEFWKIVHEADGGQQLIEACRALDLHPKTVDGFKEIKGASVEDRIERVARFLWLTNFSFANDPPIYLGNGWKIHWTKLASSAKWGRTYSWLDCVKRLKAVVSVLRGMPCRVKGDGLPLLAELPGWATVFADPPYAGLTGYVPNQADDFITPILTTPAQSVLLVESIDLAGSLPPGWSADLGDVVARVSNAKGAQGRRKEWLYASPALVSGSAVTSHQ